MTKRNPDIVCIPIVETIEVKAPRTLFPINWEDIYGKENVRYDPYPALDENGNEITKYDIYITKDKVTFSYKRKNNLKPKHKLFKTYNDIKEKEKEENEKQKIKSSNLL